MSVQGVRRDKAALSSSAYHEPLGGLLGVHSRYGLHTSAVTVFRDTLSEGFSYFVTSTAAPVASGWSVRRVGFAPTVLHLDRESPGSNMPGVSLAG
jgi:hypothetical protein